MACLKFGVVVDEQGNGRDGGRRRAVSTGLTEWLCAWKLRNFSGDING